MTSQASIPLRSTPEGLVLQVKVHPRARRTVVSGIVGDALKLSVTAPADQGKANQAVRELLAAVCAVPLAAVTIVNGQTSPRKAIHIADLSESEARQRLQSALQTGEG